MEWLFQEKKILIEANIVTDMKFSVIYVEVYNDTVRDLLYDFDI